MHKLLLAVLACLILATVPAGAAPVFTFSFSSGVGTVTGEILGLNDNTSSEGATDIIITSYPNSITGYPAAPVDLFALAGRDIVVNEFTVANGQITAANFGEYSEGAEFGLLCLDCVSNLAAFGQNYLNSYNNSGNAVTASAGFDGVMYAEVPEPGTLAILGTALVGLMARRRRWTARGSWRSSEHFRHNKGAASNAAAS